jgi:hypothetical protein
MGQIRIESSLRVKAEPRSKGVIQAFHLLRVSLVLLLVGAAADKIFQSFRWEEYLPPVVPWLFGTDSPHFLAALGIFELGLALGIVFRPSFFGALTSLWILFVNLILVAGGNFHALRLLDMGLAIAAFALFSLGQIAGMDYPFRFKPKRFRLVEPSYPRFRVVR